MSKFYTTTRTDAIKTTHTARAHHWAKVSAQSWAGSARLEISEVNGAPYVSVYVAEGSTNDGGRRILSGRLVDLLAMDPVEIFGKHPAFIVKQ